MASTRPIRLLVLHVHAITRIGVVSALRACSDIEVIDDSSYFADERPVPFLVAHGPCPVDVVLADYCSGLLVATEGTRRGSVSVPHVLIVSTMDGEWEVRNALEHGVRGYVLPNCPL